MVWQKYSGISVVCGAPRLRMKVVSLHFSTRVPVCNQDMQHRSLIFDRSRDPAKGSMWLWYSVSGVRICFKANRRCTTNNQHGLFWSHQHAEICARPTIPFTLNALSTPRKSCGHMRHAFALDLNIWHRRTPLVKFRHDTGWCRMSTMVQSSVRAPHVEFHPMIVGTALLVRFNPCGSDNPVPPTKLTSFWLKSHRLMI